MKLLRLCACGASLFALATFGLNAQDCKSATQCPAQKSCCPEKKAECPTEKAKCDKSKADCKNAAEKPATSTTSK